MNCLGRECILHEFSGQSLGSANILYKNDNLVELEVVQQIYELGDLLTLFEINGELFKTV